MRGLEVEKVVCYVVRGSRLLAMCPVGRSADEVGLKALAGTVEPGESPAKAAIREVLEETGVADAWAVVAGAELELPEVAGLNELALAMLRVHAGYRIKDAALQAVTGQQRSALDALREVPPTGRIARAGAFDELHRGSARVDGPAGRSATFSYRRDGFADLRLTAHVVAPAAVTARAPGNGVPKLS